jgi:adenine-specific DNA-methyltransferase
LRANGKCGFIIPNPWLTNLKQDATRRFICSSASIEQIVHFKFPVFRSAVVDTEIVILSSPLNNRNRVRIFSCPRVQPNGSLALSPIATHSQKDWIGLDGGVINIFLSARERSLFSKIQQRSQPLERWFQINVGLKPYQKGKGSPPQTENDVKKRPFDATNKLDRTYRELLRGSDINRYIIFPQPRFISYGAWLAEPRPAAGFDSPEKILMRQTGDRPIAALDLSQRLAMNNLHVLAPLSLNGLNIRYFLGIINSTLITWFYRCLNPEAGEALAEVKRANVAELPIFPIDLRNRSDSAKHERIVALVTRILDLSAKLAGEKNPESRKHLHGLINAIDHQIDQSVYNLYGLVPEEVEIIEEAQRVPAR